MKFHLLAIGQDFEFQGKAYSKVGPLTAQCHDTSHNRMIPRSAMVTVLDQAANKQDTHKEESAPTLSAGQLEPILEAYHQHLLQALFKGPLDESKLQQIKARMQQQFS